MMDSPAESQSMLPGRPAALEPIATDNPYIFGNPELDRLRLETQDRLIGERMQARARALVGDNVRNILDLGCGEGQLGLRLLEVYPAAHLVGLDKDPKAITTAEARARVAGAQARYEVGDVEAVMPAGPFDLIFASLILLHTRQVRPVIARIWDATRPGGVFWATEFHPDFRNAVDHPAYRQLVDWFYQTLLALGVQADIGRDLPGLLAEQGYTDIRTQTETYPLGGSSPEAQATLAALLGGFYNARIAISHTQGVPESDILQLYTDLANYAFRTKQEVGAIPSLYVVAHRPRP